MQKPWVILDRDGVINFDSKDYIKSPDEWRPLPKALEAIALLNQKGYAVAVATNQSGLARGYFTEQTLTAIHQKMTDQCKALDAHIQHIAYCPHGPNGGCDCRKPKPGLLHQLQKRFQFELASTYYVGDSFRDIQAAQSAGCKPVLVQTGNGPTTLNKHPELANTIDCFECLHSFASTL